jgi:hypothetical protein
MLILLHTFIDVVGNNAPGLHTNADDVSEFLLIRSLAPISLSIPASQNVGVELSSEFVQSVNFCAFCENTQTIEVLHNQTDAVVGLYPRCLSIRGRTHEISKLLQDLILSRLFVDRNLICGGSKLGAVIAKLCGPTLLMD